MTADRAPDIHSAEVVVPCADLDADLAALTNVVGLRVDAVFPADAPRVAVVSGHGVRLRLDTEAEPCAGTVRVASGEAHDTIVLSSGWRFVFVPLRARVPMPPVRPAFVLARAADARWGAGRAGMGYRDLDPGRQGGAFVASHIRIPGGGPVPDYVHFHRVRFQMIFCHRGSVRVVYEDQGEPFWMHPGDCVLQPPEIRHRVLESSDDLEVVEIASPAEHETLADHEMVLPNDRVRPDREFSGQRFLRAVADGADWSRRAAEGFEARETGMAAATAGLADAVVVRAAGGDGFRVLPHDDDLHVVFVRSGGGSLGMHGEEHRLASGDAFVSPRGAGYLLTSASPDLEYLQVTVASSA
jgi:quercetin dioxygenase-like cupin family protein